MKDLYFDNKQQLEHFLKNKTFLGKGAEGSCYRYEDSTLKIFDGILKDEIRNIKYDKNYYLQFKDINVENFHFVKNIIYLNDAKDFKIIGLISNYASGNNLDYNSLYDVPIDSIINSLEILLDNILSLSNNLIAVKDAVFIKNILYDGKIFKFIDTSNFFFIEEDPYYIYKNNVVEIMKELIISIINGYGDSCVCNYFKHVSSEYNYYYDPGLLADPIKYLKKLKLILEEYCEKEIKTFKDCESIMKKKIKY